MGGFTRRRLLAATGGTAVGVAGAGAVGYADALAGPRPGTVPFHGAHQAGVTTPPPARLMFAAFDLTLTTAPQLRDLLRAWSHAAALMTAGRPVGSPAGAPDAAPADTGEALGLPASNLTLTFGLGPGVFDRDGNDRFGLAARRPRPLSPLGAFPGDRLVAARSGGDVCVQACADDPQVAFHAVRDLARIAHGAAALRWTQFGFGRAAATSRAQATPRNLQGFKDGTNNLEASAAAQMRRYVWVGRDEPQEWMHGGTYLVTRRIRMLVEKWDDSALADQEDTIGRHKRSGAPLGERAEHDPVDLAARRPDGSLVIPAARPHPSELPRHERRRAHPAAWLQLHGRHRPGHGRARRRPLLHLLPARSARPVRRPAVPARGERRPERVRSAHVQRALRRPAGRTPGRVHRRGPLHTLTAPTL